MKKPYRLLEGILILLLSACFSLPVWAQQWSALTDILYPGTVAQSLHYPKGKTVYLQLVAQPVEKVLFHYLRLARQPEWRLDFPSEQEAQAWLRGLEATGETRVFMLNLYHRKTKINFSLTLGEREDTRDSRPQSIITVYGQQRPFGR
ncbi:MAG: hypothetical protein ACO1RX_01390 [Candidatus Sericytochromatia bacterium]